jgi:hypothetical protein
VTDEIFVETLAKRLWFKVLAVEKFEHNLAIR